ncbi:MAG: nuclear transport factor 2 family protein [Myxococcales bacterium]|nr:nuclear transport factor 2 family protein [Myxococcales bacterium]
MHPNTELLKTFYTAFGERNAEGMAACYAKDIHFSDPVFPNLKGGDAGDMWRMLCEAGADLQIVATGFEADETKGKAHWQATYSFSQTGRKVVNEIDAEFTFKDGQIVRHVDTFDLYKWTRMALGPAGIFLGWTPLLQNKVRGMAGKGLKKWQRDRDAKS